MNFETILIIFLVGLISFVISIASWRSYRNGGKSSNEKVMEKILEKHKSKFWKKSNWKSNMTFGGGTGRTNMKKQRYKDNKITDGYDYLRGLDTSITDKNGNLKGLHDYD